MTADETVERFEAMARMNRAADELRGRAMRMRRAALAFDARAADLEALAERIEGRALALTTHDGQEGES